MITFVKGNLLEDSAQALVNTVNTVGVMGKGIALQFRETFPNNYQAYRRACKAGAVVVGKMFITEEQSLNGGKIIVNFPTKTTWRRPSEYSYISSGLEDLKYQIQRRGITSIAIPPLGSHNGGLDWLVVKKMIEDTLGTLNCDIRLYEPSDAIVERMKAERVRMTPARAMLLNVMCDRADYGEFDSVFAAEKIVYFLQRFGAEDIFHVKFSRNIYGPYSGGVIAHVLYAMNGSYIKGMGGMQARPFDDIWLLDDTKMLSGAFLMRPENKNALRIVNQTQAFLRGYYSNFTLELLSTVDYLLVNDSRLANWVEMSTEYVIETLNQDLHEWSHRKENLFAGTPYLDIVLRHLREYKEYLYS